MTTDPNLRLEVQRLDDEAHALRAALEPFAKRVGAIQETVDRLYAELDESEVDRIREQTGCDELLTTCLELKSHASAAADDVSSDVCPQWYEDLLDRRAARILGTSRKASA